MSGYWVRIELDADEGFQRPSEKLRDWQSVGGDGWNPGAQERYKFTLLDDAGNVVLAFENRQLGDGVRKLCSFINKPTESMLSTNQDTQLPENAANQDRQQGR